MDVAICSWGIGFYWHQFGCSSSLIALYSSIGKLAEESYLPKKVCLLDC